MSQEMENQGFELSAEELDAVAGGGTAVIKDSTIKNEKVKVNGSLTLDHDIVKDSTIDIGRCGKLNITGKTTLEDTKITFGW